MEKPSISWGYYCKLWKERESPFFLLSTTMRCTSRRSNQTKSKLRPFWSVCKFRLPHWNPKWRNSKFTSVHNCTTDEINAQCCVSAKSVSKFARYVNEKAPDQFQPLVMTDDKKLRHLAARETEEIIQFTTEAVQEGTNRADQDV